MRLNRKQLQPLQLGAALFALQVAVLGWTHIASLKAKNATFARQAMGELLSTPASLGWLIFYVALGICVHATPFAFARKITTDLQKRGPARIRQRALQRGFTLLVALMIFSTMLAWDRYLFPRKLTLTQGTFAELIQLLAPIGLSSMLLLTLLATWLATAASRRALATTALVFLALLLPGFSMFEPPPPRERAPDVIILGADSLRRDHLLFNGGLPGTAPTIDRMLSQSVSFDRAYTPMARTFVAYMSILSGLYPNQHGVRENLWPRSMFDTKASLPHSLRDAGYTTAFALDEVRFANLDGSFGFDHLVMPPPGTLELVAGSLLDTVGTNLLQMLPGSEQILPHIVGNRALQHNYRPSLQNRKIGRVIADAPTERPLLLIAHFCIAHIPFATGQVHSATPVPPFHDSPVGYRKALQLVDRQIEQTMLQLKAAGRLENAVVVLLADHGEGLGMDKDRWRDGDRPDNALGISATFGHGTKALENTENHIVLSFQRYVDGRPTWQAGSTAAPASLVDVTPTLLSILGLTSERTFGGIPLLDLEGKVVAPAERPIFVESGIAGDSLETLDIDTGEIINEFAHLYRVNQDLRVELASEELPGLLASKQRGMIMGRYGVAAVPSTGQRGCWLLADYETRTQLCRKDPAQNPIIDAYSREICSHYASDAAFHQHWCKHLQTAARPPLAQDLLELTSESRGELK